MNHADIEKEYLNSTCKTRTVIELAKKYGVSQSDIIFELLKTGYKFDELKRGNPGAYKPAVKKYERWKKAGGTLEAESDEDVMKQYEEKPELDEESQETFSSEQIIDMQKEEIAKLQNQISEMNKQAESKKVHDFNEAVDNMVEENKLKQKIRELEEKLEESESERAHADERLQTLVNECNLNTAKVDELTDKLSDQEQLTEDTIRLLKIRENDNKSLKEEKSVLESWIDTMFKEIIINHAEYPDMTSVQKSEAVSGAIAELKRQAGELIKERDELKTASANNTDAVLEDQNTIIESLTHEKEQLLKETSELKKANEEASVISTRLRKCEQYILDMMVYDN